MTTQVTIINHGPDHVLVRTFPKDNEPGDWGMRFTASDFIPPKEVRSYWLHGNQGLVVDEDKRGPQS